MSILHRCPDRDDVGSVGGVPTEGLMSHSRTARLALVGRAISYSVSPALHQALFVELRPQLNADVDSISYELIDCADSSSFRAWLAAAPSNGFWGANVTIPFKRDLAETSDASSVERRCIGTANTVCFGDTRRVASTDGFGFRLALARLGWNNLAGRELVMIGSGGAARSILWALRDAGLSDVTLVVRDSQTATLAARILPLTSVQTLSDSGPMLERRVPRLIVQATPVGQGTHADPVPTLEFAREDVVVDLVYRPLETTLLQRAKAAGATAIDGLGMLIEQAALSQLLWFKGALPTRSPLSDAAFRAIRTKMEFVLS